MPLTRQVVLDSWFTGQPILFSTEAISQPAKFYLKEIQLLPAYISAISLLIFIVQLFGFWFAKKNESSETSVLTENNDSQSIRGRFKQHVQSLGGSLIYAYRSARLVACLVLVGLSFYSAFHFKEDENHDTLRPVIPSQLAYSIVYVYASVLSLVTVAASARWARIAIHHLVPVLLVPWAVLVYRDIYPLCTYTLSPADAREGIILWEKIAVLTYAAIFVPLFVPREYIPFDPTEPMQQPNEEQTASWGSLLFFSFRDSIIWKGYRQPHIKVNDLPALGDSEYTKNLVKRGYQYLDPLVKKKKTHIFFSLFFRVFAKEQAHSIIAIILRVFASFLAPIGLNRLLNYMETGGEGATIRPWVWVVWIFTGPVAASLTLNWAFYKMAGSFVVCSSLLTQLIFDHSLRIRVKAETSNASLPAETSPSTAVATPDSASATDVPIPGSSAAESDSTSAASSKAKDTPSDAVPEKEKGDSNLVGKINNLVTADINNIQGGQNVLFAIFETPLQIVLSLIALYKILGWSVVPGIAVMIISLPIPVYITKYMNDIQVTRMKKSDARVQSVTETINVIRMIKLFGWERKMSDQLADKRQEELDYVWKSKVLEAISNAITSMVPIGTMIATFLTQTIILKRPMTASIIFPAIAIFLNVEDNLYNFFRILPATVQAKVSLDRINDFLNETELLDQFSPGTSGTLPTIASEPVDQPDAPIGIRSTSFTWTSDTSSISSDGFITPGGTRRRNFKLRIEGEVFFKKGRVNLIVGPTGSGKTSFLMALLGEMHNEPMGPESLVSLPRQEGIAYHAQESWVLNETIKNNILFGSPYDEERYNAVIEQCGLKRDLTLFDAGDATEVGEKGLTLSGGQKARITLARAVYSPAKILLLDDVLAALDVHTAKWIVQKCFQGDLVRGRTVILVTHNIALTAPIAEFVVSLGNDGRIVSQGSLSHALAEDKNLSAELAKEKKTIEEAEEAIDEEIPGEPVKKSDGKLIVEEEIAEGHVGWTSLKLLFANMAGRHGLLIYWVAFWSLAILFRISANVEAYVLALWANAYDTHEPSEVSDPFYLGLYCANVALSITFFLISFPLFMLGTLRASRAIHKMLIDSMFGAPLRWLDKTPASRIIARCTQDIAAIDGPVATFMGALIDITLSIVVKFFAVLLISPLFGVIGLAVALAGGWLGNIYMQAQLPVKRENSNAKSPVLGHFGAAIAGLVSIRAYGAQDMFRQESYKRIDVYTTTGRIFWDLNRWIGIRTDALGGIFSAGLAAYLLYQGRTNAADTGFSLNMAIGFSTLLLYWVRIFNLVETNGNSLERIQQYLEIDQEPKPTKTGVPPAYWPASGELVVENLSARYSADGPKVLQNISFHIKSGERVGIVGRTGSGKSSLTLALLRCILTEGTVLYDGVDTSTLNLDALRSQITIIPQVPELLSGTLRQNLDPFEQYDDALLNDALRAAGLFSLQDEGDEGKITLDTAISGGGSNLSVGQRQILALARAIVRQSKLLILDEATSAIDYETDTVIQQSLRKELRKDVTLLTVAHRLQTIMDADKIMVLDAGRITEFGAPIELLQNPDGMLRALVDESGDREKLLDMAKSAASSS
ncbi:ATP-binding cassette transporter C [Abortiporus biennis]